MESLEGPLGQPRPGSDAGQFIRIVTSNSLSTTVAIHSHSSFYSMDECDNLVTVDIVELSAEVTDRACGLFDECVTVSTRPTEGLWGSKTVLRGGVCHWYTPLSFTRSYRYRWK